MLNDRYVAYDSDCGEYETFETFEEAKKWFQEGFEDNGIGTDSIEGKSFIAKITHSSKYIIDDRKENYHEHTKDCPEDCDKEEWPWEAEYDTVGHIEFQSVINNVLSENITLSSVKTKII